MFLLFFSRLLEVATKITPKDAVSKREVDRPIIFPHDEARCTIDLFSKVEGRRIIMENNGPSNLRGVTT